jgi:hypothetical protein
MEDQTETVIFRSFYKKGFGLPAGAFFSGLLHYYGLEATHLKPNSIAQIAIFIHLCEGFVGIPAHFNLWRALCHLRVYPKKGTPDVVGGATFSLHYGGKYLEVGLRDSNKKWAEEWFMVPNAKWEEKPFEEEMVQVEFLLAELLELKAGRLTRATVALSFSKRLTQPIQERVHTGYEYSGWDHRERGGSGQGLPEGVLPQAAHHRSKYSPC